MRENEGHWDVKFKIRRCFRPGINGIIRFSWMDLEGIMRSEIRQRKPNIWYYLHVESTKQNKWTNRNRLIDTENKLMVARREGFGWSWVKNVKGLRSTNWQLLNSLRDVKYSIGITVSNNIIPLHGARWVLEISGRTLYKVHDCLIAMLYSWN